MTEIVHRYGGLFICDEVQTGFGRLGDTMFGIEQWDVEPDIMTMAKGIANGLPLANTITTTEIAESTIGNGLTISTFGGNPLACAASLATIEAMEEEATPEHIGQVGRRLRAGLEKLQEKYPLIGDVRGIGLMQAAELVKDRQSKEPAIEETAYLLDQTKALGLLVGKGGMYSNALRIAPPLIATTEHVDEALEKLDHAFARTQEMSF